ncbi:DUF945 domain-containing protein [Campylobacter sp. FMV-PI01]|uniref:DUF945 domain-containing protein n=1 Tax=Campylobacter portucalensis TaxID=2608384 RepID=A0A6L5WFL9_9BACT|nr:hypothetical protein [Campylobacter portucalensis]MSN95868.1 DUF945 domain-containing protein [Campylobacter portucalensis]
MKKLFILFFVLVILFIGGGFYLANQIETKNEALFQNIFNSTNNFKNSYKKGFLKTQIKSKFTIKKDKINSLLIYEEIVKEDLEFEAIYSVENSVLNLITGFKASGDIVLKNLEDGVKKIFGTQKIATFETIMDTKGNAKTKFALTPVNFNNHNAKITTSSAILKFNHNYLGIKDLNFSLDNFNFLSGVNELNLEKMHQKVEYKQIFPFQVFFDLKNFYLIDAKSEQSFSEISFKIGNFKTSLKDYTDNSKVEVNKDKFGAEISGKLQEIEVLFENKPYKFLNLKYDIDLKDLSKNFYEEIISKSKYDKIHTIDLEKLGLKFLSTSPKIYINNINFLDDQNRTFKASIGFGLEDFNVNNLLTIQDNIFLKGMIEFSDSYLDLILNGDKEAKKAVLDSKILLQKDQNLRADFEFDKNKLDIILNNSIGLNEMFYGHKF